MSNAGFVVTYTNGRYPILREQRPRLGHLDIELTERCNNACLHCYINLPANDAIAKQQELNTDLWKDILKQAADLGALSIRFTGGEPLLREDFADLYLFTRRLGMKVYLFTNACLITSELADLFVRVPPLKKIEISSYGMYPKSYDAITCRKGAYFDFRRGIDLLIKNQIPILIKSVLLPPNQMEKEEFEAWVATIPGMDRRPPYAVFLDYRGRRDSPAKNRMIDKLRFSPDDGLKFLARDEDAYRKSMAQYCVRFIGPPGNRLFNCEAGESGCVDAYGNYQMCMLLRHPDTVFDLSRSTMRQALAEFFPHVRELKAANPDYLQRCARCFLKGLCEQCPAKSWSEHGTLDTPVEYLCQLAHVQARYLGLLNASEQGWEVTDWHARVANLASRYGYNSLSEKTI